MKPGLFFIALFFCSKLAAASAGEQNLASQYEQWFHQQISTDKVIGAAFAVASRDGIIQVGTAGHTDTTRKQAINHDTAFRIASVSKTFAAELAAKMVQEGLFNWNDPVNLHVPDFLIKGDTGKIHVQHLLGQSTGLMPHAYDNLIEDGMSASAVQSKLKELSFICVPGECYSYQNSVFSLIQPVIEKNAGNSYANLIEQRIFKPLDMTTASVGFEAFMATQNRARPHVKRRGQWKTVKVLPNYYRIAPAAGINASVVDMGKWLMAQLGANPQVLAPEVLSDVITPRVRTPRELYPQILMIFPNHL
jgi:beta-lactamase class C